MVLWYTGDNNGFPEINENLEDAPEMINADPYGDGWICRMSIANSEELTTHLDAAGYTALLGE